MERFYKPILIACMFFLASIDLLVAQKIPHWTIDSSQSEVNFTVKHVFLPVKGIFKEYNASINFHPAFPERSKAEFNLKVSSLKTNNKDRDRHLQSPDFFDAANYPEIKFTSSRIELVKENEFLVKGSLMMRGVSKEIEFPIIISEPSGLPKKDGFVSIRVLLNTIVDRSDYGIGRGNWASSSAIGNKVKISINLLLESSDAN